MKHPKYSIARLVVLALIVMWVMSWSPTPGLSSIQPVPPATAANVDDQLRAPIFITGNDNDILDIFGFLPGPPPPQRSGGCRDMFPQDKGKCQNEAPVYSSLRDEDFEFNAGNGLAAGDVDGDGIDELIIAGDSAGFVEIFKLNGPRIRRILKFQTGFRTCSGLAVGDADGDGKADIVIANANSLCNRVNDPGFIDIYKIFTEAPDQFRSEPIRHFFVEFRTGNALAVGDLDSMHPGEEIAVAGNTCNCLDIFEINGASADKGENTPIRKRLPVDFRTGNALAIGDVDGILVEGRTVDEIIIAGQGAGKADIFRIDGRLRGKEHEDQLEIVDRERCVNFTSGDALAVGDVDGDGVEEILVAGDGNGFVDVFRGSGPVESSRIGCFFGNFTDDDGFAVGTKRTLRPATPPTAPLVFIPGIAGSNLYKEGLITEGANLWLGHVDTDHRKLTLDPEKDQVPIKATDALRVEVITVLTDVGRVPVKTEVVYEPLLQMLTSPFRGRYREYQSANAPSRLTEEGCDLSQIGNSPNLFVFPYDWRKDNAENARKLGEYIKCVQKFHPNSRVDILAHSMGGLLARRFILDNPGKVDKLITIGSPWLGAPKMINVLETGEFLDNFFSFAIVFDSTMKELAEFFPGAHQLMPSRDYYRFKAPPFKEEGWDINGNGIAVEVYTYEQLRDLFNSRYPRSGPIRANEIFHGYSAPLIGNQDDWSNDNSGVKYFHIVGIEEFARTIGEVRARRITACSFGICTPPIDFFDLGLTYGDRTVPQISAQRIAAVGDQLVDLNHPDAKIIQFTGPDDDPVGHVEMTQNPLVHDKVLTILKSRIPVQPFGPVLNPSFYLTLIGAASVIVTDETGNHTDPLRDPPDNRLPDIVSYKIGAQAVLISMSPKQKFTFTFRSGDAPMAIGFVKGVTNVMPTEAIRYQDLKLPAGVLAELKIAPQGADMLRYDSDGDGTFETAVNPTVSVTGPAAQDVEAPEIRFNTVVQADTTRVTISAKDGGTGVKALLYSLDGRRYLPYTGTISLNPFSPQVLFAFADDNVANRSGVYTLRLPPITRPPDVNITAPAGRSSAIVSYPLPAINNNPRITTVVCSPISGASFPVGVTTVTCTATDAAGNVTTTAFAVTVNAPISADVCLQDGSTGDVFQFNSFTGAYQFTRCGIGSFTLTGKGKVSRKGCTLTLEDIRADRGASASLNTCRRTGEASVRSPSLGTIFKVTDRNTNNNTCTCP